MTYGLDYTLASLIFTHQGSLAIKKQDDDINAPLEPSSAQPQAELVAAHIRRSYGKTK